ncbi:NAD(P)H dehydrogenase [Mesorhizobium ephedrae]|uniref:NAD(P)H dehydrogenase n=1 Tax=Kumtagia ephedrae TaxID=2116701 RepID=A0A2P7SS28_9HYPH|nr:NAD(P)H dehydrogenase [Mesorhizobium ephedrae]
MEVCRLAKIAIVYYSSTGHHYALGKAIEEGARAEGAETRLRKVRELAPDAAIDSRPGWRENLEATSHVEEAALADLEWADGFVFGTPTRFGLPSAQLKQFLDQTGGLWAQGKLQDKPVSMFCGAGNPHGGQEATLLTLATVFYHWGSVIVPTGYTDPSLKPAGGNPYGVSFTASKDGLPAEAAEAGRYLGRRIARFAEALAAARERIQGRG